jgi:glycosyltransferase involved in cell wall biosynthesis
MLCFVPFGENLVITLIVPTRNRAHTLRLVAPSYFHQDAVSELIFVDDSGDDDTSAVIAAIARDFPQKTSRVLRNDSRLGASQSRNVGIAASSNELILFCDDDEYLETGYARTLLQKLTALDAGAISGRRVYMLPGETQEDALRRFGSGMRSSKPFRRLICEYVNAAKFSGEIAIPVTNAIILTKKHLLLKFPFDDRYARGNGYREETDYQMNLFVNGFDIYVSNACHSFHLPLSQVRLGGQRTRPFQRLYWSIHYTRYFFGKYYEGYARRLGLHSPRWFALAAFAVFAAYRETLRPLLYAVAMQALTRGSRPENPSLPAKSASKTSETPAVLTFVIPVRHPANSSDWPALKGRLEQTMRSIAAQDDIRWRAIIVANKGSDLPALPKNFELEEVDFPPNPMFERGDNDIEAFRDTFRIDKGRRVLAGILAADRGGHVMVVDDDDFVSCRLTSFVASHQAENGWYVQNGYLWGEGGRLIYEYADFSKFCGTSHIVKTALYSLPASVAAADPESIRKLFGSHVFIREYLADRGVPLRPLPFAGAVYRIGHAGAHSKSPGLLRQVFFKRELLKNPLNFARRFARLRLLGTDLRHQFWGSSATGRSG